MNISAAGDKYRTKGRHVKMGKMLDSAIEFAIKAHAGQVRKADGSPYVLHTMEAAVIAGTLTRDEAVIAASLLHDVIEHTWATTDEIRELFGDRVAALVEAVTEDKMTDLPPKETWRLRKIHSLRSLFDTDDDGVKIMWLANKLSNLRSMAVGVRAEGDDFFKKFNQTDKELHEWYYREVQKALLSL